MKTCNLKIVFTSPIRVKSFFTFKDKLSKMLLSGLVYRCKCGCCNATYYGKNKRHFKVRICEHLGISHLTGKKVNIDNNKLTAIQEHLLCCNYSPSFEDFFILTRESNDFKLKIMESLLIELDKPILNKGDSSLPLELFQYNSGYYTMFYHIILCASIPSCVYNCRLCSSCYYVTSFVFYQKQNVRAFIIILGVTMKAVAFES